MVEIRKPLNTPNSTPPRTPIKTAGNTPQPLKAMRPPVTTPESAMTEPTEMSMPPKMITSVIAQARFALMDTCRSTFKRFFCLKNSPDEKLKPSEVKNCNSSMIAKRPIRIAPLSLKYFCRNRPTALPWSDCPFVFSLTIYIPSVARNMIFSCDSASRGSVPLTRPSPMTTTRSDMLMISGSSDEIMMIATPFAASSFMMA